MIVETVKITADALKDATIGVNQQISNVDLYSGHDTPPDVEAVETVLDNEDVAKGAMPTRWPALLLSPDRPFRVEGEVTQVHRQAEDGGVAIRYATADPDTAKAVRDGLYTLRAVGMTLKELMDDGNADMRTEHGVQLLQALRWDMGALVQERQGGMVTAALVVTYSVRDTKP